MFNHRYSHSSGSAARSSRPRSGSFKRRSPSSASASGSFNRGRRPSSARRPQGGMRFDRIDPNKFINKAVITEEIEHFVPEHKFSDFKIDEALKKTISAKGYVDPTPIQDRAIAHVLEGRDVVGIANTGTGKTAAFLIPLLNKIRHSPKERVLILVPTRELALQIDEELKGFARGMHIYSVCTVGGMNINPQIAGLRRSYNFVIGTPGRVKDLIERRSLRLSDFRTVVLDEADRMLDMGFVNDMRFVMKGMAEDRHTLFFSATLSSEIEKLIGEFLREPVRISVKTRDTSKNVDQDIVKVSGGAKLDVLHDLLNKNEFSKVIVFGRTKHGVEKLSKELVKRGFKADSIHGNKTHGKRQRALSSFKAGHVQVLVATDVAARGLDIADVSHVINYDLPATYDDYVHRIGRTGRGEKKGVALTFIE